MKVLGISYTTKETGEKSMTLHVSAEFPAYASDKAAGRGCSGFRAEKIYVGSYDCSAIKVGSEIEIYYEEAIKTKTGNIFQPIKKIEVIGK